MANDAFQNFKSSVNRGITSISVKTSSSLEKSKIKTHMDSLEAEGQKLLMSIGETAFSVWQSGSMDYQAITELCVALQQKKDEIVKLSEELSSIDARDEQILGTAKQQAAAPAPDAQPTCPSCGAPHDPAAKFCRKCGFKLQ